MGKSHVVIEKNLDPGIPLVFADDLALKSEPTALASSLVSDKSWLLARNGTGTGILFVDADNVWGNYAKTDRASVAADAHYGIGQTWDYYLKVDPALIVGLHQEYENLSNDGFRVFGIKVRGGCI